jgi:hypothetical protein
MAETPSARTEPEGEPFEVRFALERGEFLLFNWAQALERPMLPFLFYTFTLLALASLVGIWPAGRIYGLAALAPLLAYLIWVQLSAATLWRRYPQLRQDRLVVLGPERFEVEAGGERYGGSYAELASVLESRSGIYLLHGDGRAELLPKRALARPDGVRELIEPWLEAGSWRRSAYL